MMNILVRKFSP